MSSNGSGIDRCKKLRDFESTTPILFYSGAADERDKHEAYASGAQGYLTKPVDCDELVEEVFGLVSVTNSLAFVTNSPMPYSLRHI